MNKPEELVGYKDGVWGIVHLWGGETDPWGGEPPTQMYLNLVYRFGPRPLGPGVDYMDRVRAEDVIILNEMEILALAAKE